jgi:cell fate regulator YaaT (PSP1 superfamily)
MCCLKYEQEAYEELGKTMPRIGAVVETPDGRGEVINVNLVRQIADVKLDNNLVIKQYKGENIKIIKNGDQKIGKSTMDELKELED